MKDEKDKKVDEELMEVVKVFIDFFNYYEKNHKNSIGEESNDYSIVNS